MAKQVNKSKKSRTPKAANSRKVAKRVVSIGIFTLILSIFTLVAYNIPFFQAAAQCCDSEGSGTLLLCSLAAIMLVFNYLIYYLLLYLLRIVGRVIIALLFIGNALSLYFINTYEVLITSEMMGNVFNTRYSEASGYFSLAGVLYVLLLGIIPALYILLRKVDFKGIKQLGINVGISIVLIGGIVVCNMHNTLWIDRNVPELGSLILPYSYGVNSIRYYNQWKRLNQKEILLPDATITNSDKSLCVVVIGESARRENFSLYGYERNTNPLLANDNVTPLMAESSATYTTAGVKAILDHKPSKELYEILPNYLYRNGVEVIWRSCNWGEPPLHIEHYYSHSQLRELYPEVDGRYDGILLAGLGEQIAASDKDKILVVLHCSTSHGPTYYQKYPSDFERFTPVCRSVEMANADHDELINAYDNTILYTDYLLHSLIEILSGIEDRESTMLFISDHGESLGEDNLYMHGVPMSMAPKQQYEIPFIVWQSNNKLKIKPLEMAGHYNVFHSVLRILSVDSPIYDESKSIFE